MTAFSATFFRGYPLRMAAMGCLCTVILMAFIGPWISPFAYDGIDLLNANSPPSWEHWFGTDDLGRDGFVRCCYGARISLFVGLIATLIDTFIGVLWGAFAGILGGRWEAVMMRGVDIVHAIPQILLVVFLMVLLRPGLFPILLAIMLVGWLNMARIVRGEVIRLKALPFILAAKAIGVPRWRLVMRHLLPNAQGPIFVTAALTIPTAIFMEALLSFLGLGVAQPMASWGTMVSEGVAALAYYPWRLFFPATLISLTLLSLNLLIEGLQETLDPKGQVSMGW